MRPRLLHLGSYVSLFEAQYVLRRFNEAEAFTPRIRQVSTPIGGRQIHRFNEAEAFTPRIRIFPSRKAPTRPPWASMRPRLLHLGSENPEYSSQRVWYGFNEAEAFTPRILRSDRKRFRFADFRFNEAEAFTPRIRSRTA